MEISIKDLIRIFKHSVVFMLLVAIIFSMVAFCYSSFFAKETYTTTVKLYVNTDDNKAESDIGDSLTSHNYAIRLVDTYIEMLKTNSFYSQVSADLDNKYTVGQIKSMVDFTSNETEVFSASVNANSGVVAKEVADSVARVAPSVISELNRKAKLKIVDPAILPTAPTSPNTGKNTFIAFAIGFILAMIYSFVKDFLDIKIKYHSDMTAINDYPILAAIPDFNDSSRASDYKLDTSLYTEYTPIVKESEGK